jgi:hypothetical protein
MGMRKYIVEQEKLTVTYCKKLVDKLEFQNGEGTQFSNSPHRIFQPYWDSSFWEVNESIKETRDVAKHRETIFLARLSVSTFVRDSEDRIREMRLLYLHLFPPRCTDTRVAYRACARRHLLVDDLRPPRRGRRLRVPP